MDLKKAYRVLIDHNQWRRGEGKYGYEGKTASDPYPHPPHSPVEIGQAIDVAVRFIKNYGEIDGPEDV